MTATRALTLHQPWASLIAVGAKMIETRAWIPSPEVLHRRLAIHAGSRIPPYARAIFRDDDALLRPLAGSFSWSFPDRAERQLQTDLPLGAVVAVVTVAGWVATNDIIWRKRGAPWTVDQRGVVVREDQRQFGDFSPGRYAWLLDELEVVDPPVPASGNQGFWTWRHAGSRRAAVEA